MTQQIYRSINEPIRSGLSREELWEREDQGLINCWEIGRELRKQNSDLVKSAENGELPILVFKGGFKENIKKRWRYGTFNYLAVWQGLRGENLKIDLSKNIEIICSKTGKKTIFTNDIRKFGEV